MSDNYSWNKGEWSEIYAFLNILGEGEISGADTDLNKIADRIFKVKEVQRDYLDPPRNYKVDNSYVIILDGSDNEISRIKKKKFIDASEILLKEIKSGHKEIPKIESFLSQIDVKQIKADAKSTADIFIKLYDARTATQPVLGFSIKSLIGGKSTLFNPNNNTNFIYELNNFRSFDKDDFNTRTYQGRYKLNRRIQELINNQITLKFKKIESDNLYKNLFFIDSSLPSMFSYMLIYNYYYNCKGISEITEYLEEHNPLNFPNDERKYYKYKIKRVLRDMAMGMTADCIWNGFYEANGGTIVVKDSGDIVCYHVYDIQIFEEYLFKNTFLETPSTGEDKDNPGFPKPNPKKRYFHSWVYEENDKLFIKLNLQVRYREGCVI